MLCNSRIVRRVHTTAPELGEGARILLCLDAHICFYPNILQHTMCPGKFYCLWQGTLKNPPFPHPLRLNPSLATGFYLLAQVLLVLKILVASRSAHRQDSW